MLPLDQVIIRSVNAFLKGDFLQEVFAFFRLAFPAIHEMPIVERKLFSWDSKNLSIVEPPNRDVLRFELEHFRNHR